MAADIVYRAELDDSQVLKALQNIDKNIEKIARDGDKQFQQLGNSAKASGVQIGAISGVVSSLVTEFIRLGERAGQVLLEMGQKSVEIATGFDTLKARLGGIFDGSQEAADQAFNFIQDRSKKLGIDLSELAGAFLPKTESLAQFERVAKLATALARSDPEQGAIGARIALIEALSGTFTSLQRRFEIPKEDIDKLKEAFDKKGIEGFIEEFEKVLAASGKSFEDLSDTAQTSFDKIKIAGEQALGDIGGPIVDELKALSDELLKFLSDNEDEIKVFADSIGDAAVSVIEFFKSFTNLDSIKPEDIVELGNSIFDFVSGLEAAGTLVGRFLEIVVTLFGKLGEFIITVNGLGAAFSEVSPYLETFIGYFTGGQSGFAGFLEFIARSEAGLEGLAAILQSLTDSAYLLGQALGALASGDFAKAIELNAQSQEAFDNAIVNGQKATQEAYERNQKTIEDYNTAIAAHRDEQGKLLDTLKDTNAENTAAADAIQAKAAADREAAKAAAEYEAAQAKVNKALGEAEKDFQRKLEDIDIQTERKRLDIQIEFAQKREDAAKKNLEKLADIQKKNAQDRADAAKDLDRKEQDIARKYAEQRIDQEREQRQKRVDIEKDFRLKLQDIQRQFLIDAGEAEEKRDAVAFIRALKQRDQKIQEAQTDRQRTIDETRTEGEQKREELALQQQREIEDARIANERKLEDLKTNLDRQIEAQNTAYARELDDIAVAEQRKNEELNRSRERDIEDAQRAYDRKLEDLRASLEAELALIEEYSARMSEARAAADAAASVPSSPPRRSSSGSPGASAGFGNNPSTIANGPNNIHVPSGTSHGPPRRRAIGGPVYPGQSYFVGENGPELYSPNMAGRIIPNNQIPSAYMGGGGNIGSITYNNQKSASLGGLLDPGSLDAILQAKVQNILLNVLGGL